MMGDGGITANQVTITLNCFDEKIYSKFVVALIRRLFGVTSSVYLDIKDSVLNIVVSRTNLVDFCVSQGLVIGNKVRKQIDIPDWIKKEEDFKVACVRGLVDTDGSVFTHRYKVNGKYYAYKKLAFTSLSFPLLSSVYQILKDKGLGPRIMRNKDVRIENVAGVKKYFQIFGSHNPKHIRRYKTWP